MHGTYIRVPGASDPRELRPTPATRPMQLSAAFLLVSSGVITLLLSTLTRTYVHNTTMAALARQNPNVTPDQLRQVVDFSVGLGVAAAMVWGAVYLLLGVLTLFRLRPWTFYADLVVFGLMSAGGVATLLAVLGGTAGPLAFAIPNLLLGLGALALFVWMVAKRIRVGPWGARSAYSSPP